MPFLDKVEGFIQKHSRKLSSKDPAISVASPPPPPPPQSSGLFPSAEDVFRFRKQRGVNLGSWFTLEKWIADSPFAHAHGSSDLDVARADHARDVLEHHWDTWITEADWRLLADSGINTVRIPIGFYHICGVDPEILRGTDFSPYEHVFSGAWRRITDAIATAYRYNIGVLIDLHSAPGKQNNDAHSGAPGSPKFFSAADNMHRTTRILISLLSHLLNFTRTHEPPLPNLVGLELLNEPAPSAPGGSHGTLTKWYSSTIAALRAVDLSIPLVISDCWWTENYVEWVTSASHRNIVIDHHLYRCFTSEDGHTPAAEHAKRLSNPDHGSFKQLLSASETLANAGGGLVVGEWSAALNPGSLQGGIDAVAAKREFALAQLNMYERACSGWFFWTYKKEHGGDEGWSWRDALEKGVFPSFVGLRMRHDAQPVMRTPELEERRNSRRDRALGDHSVWWDQYPGHYEHWRFDEGFTQGWEDAYSLFAASNPGGVVSEIGLVGAWAKVRSEQHAHEHGDGNLWEFEHGFKQGINSAKDNFREQHC